MAGSLREVDSRTELDELIRTSSGKLIVAYSAPWCGYCRMLKHELQAIVDSGEAQVLVFDVDAHRGEVADKGITGLPHIEFYKDGALIRRESGFSRKDELLSKLN